MPPVFGVVSQQVHVWFFTFFIPKYKLFFVSIYYIEYETRASLLSLMASRHFFAILQLKRPWFLCHLELFLSAFQREFPEPWILLLQKMVMCKYLFKEDFCIYKKKVSRITRVRAPYFVWLEGKCLFSKNASKIVF